MLLSNKFSCLARVSNSAVAESVTAPGKRGGTFAATRIWNVGLHGTKYIKPMCHHNRFAVPAAKSSSETALFGFGRPSPIRSFRAKPRTMSPALSNAPAAVPRLKNGFTTRLNLLSSCIRIFPSTLQRHTPLSRQLACFSAALSPSASIGPPALSPIVVHFRVQTTSIAAPSMTASGCLATAKAF